MPLMLGLNQMTTEDVYIVKGRQARAKKYPDSIVSHSRLPNFLDRELTLWRNLVE